MLRRSAQRLTFMSPVDLYALDKRSSFSSYTQYADACALSRSYQRCSPGERFKFEERVKAINDEIELSSQEEDELRGHDTLEGQTPTGGMTQE
ncbi:hypothetical protein JKF63_05207 [Porcisia hertigi]|uniref:Uncharacterized protein n=1 Tax=Porcisia hertigi TaxID=2761500 RepID=A0A836IB03_9TRYP|nr:hypothetical protein JKF63_05207 [Porcisia hertigi]